MSRPPNAATLAQVRAETVEWFWREFCFMKPHKDSTDADIIAELEARSGPCDVTPGGDLLGASVLEIQEWATYIAGARASDWPFDPDTSDLATLDGV